NGEDQVNGHQDNNAEDDALWGATASGEPEDDYYEVVDETSKPAVAPLTDEQKLLCTPLMRGFSLKNKKWLNFFVSAVRDIVWNDQAFEKLVLPNNQKELILSFAESQNKPENTFDDVIAGKGKGIIVLLCGPPGVGKTLTAESIAEEMKVPLYMMSAGDLGFDFKHIEPKLQTVMEIVTRWKAILLIDEADIFLEQRSLHELERNKLVTIFLRVLEYFEGIMFLTTNRVETFDPAFQSRIHISLEYPDLSNESRRQIWQNFLDNINMDIRITEKQMNELSRLKINGRQIKNILKTSQMLARRNKGTVLEYQHIMNVMDLTQHLHKTTEVTEHTRESLYH
ncbi:hypothetical protein LTS18_009123, partial [Coniosporium uncinatum]